MDKTELSTPALPFMLSKDILSTGRAPVNAAIYKNLDLKNLDLPMIPSDM